MNQMAMSNSDSEGSESDNTYNVLLHIVEGIGLNPTETSGDFSAQRQNRVLLRSSLNGVKFEIVGHSMQNSTIFNSNCVWECELDDIKRMKTDHRPVKVQFLFQEARLEQAPPRPIGSLLLPLRGIPVISALRNLNLMMHWHKLATLSSEWRTIKPEVHLTLVIIKKSLVPQFNKILAKKRGEPESLDYADMPAMLRSQGNIHVQLLDELGVIQVGNDSTLDCDIFNVSLIMRNLCHLEKFANLVRVQQDRQINVVLFQYDFLGEVSNAEIVLNGSDSYSVSEKVSLSFKSSLHSLQMYFGRIFFIPMVLYLNGTPLANCRFEFTRLLPEENFFTQQQVYSRNGAVLFELLFKGCSPRTLKPSLEFTFCMQQLSCYSKVNSAKTPVNNNNNNNSDNSHTKIIKNQISGETATLVFPDPSAGRFQIDERAGGDVNFQKQLELGSMKEDVKPLHGYEYHGSVTGRSHYEEFQPLQNCYKASSEPSLYGAHCEDTFDYFFGATEPSTARYVNEPTLEGKKTEEGNAVVASSTKLSANACVGPSEPMKQPPVIATVGVNTDSKNNETEELTIKIVQELEAWKAQQMDQFLSELERKEQIYLTKVEREIERERAVLKAKLETKIIKCEKLNATLEKAHAQLAEGRSKDKSDVVETVKCEVERCYAKKLESLDKQMQQLHQELKQKTTNFDVQHKEFQLENTKLEQEKAALRERIQELEQQMTRMAKTRLSADQLTEMLGDLRIQSERFTEIEKSKNYYKDQWVKTTQEVNKLKLSALEEQQKLINERNCDKIELSLEDLLIEEQESLNSDRSELKSIKDMFFASSSSSLTKRSYEE